MTIQNLKLIVFNWKINPSSLKEAKWLFYNYLKILKAKNSKLKAELVIAPPFVYLTNLKTEKLKNLKLGAQNVFWENQGAYTGEISPKMLKNLGVEYVIIGHSERRKYLNETDMMINKKVLASLGAGLKVVLCVGEPKRESGSRNQELGKAKIYVKKQLEKDLKNSKFLILNSKLRNHLMIAYEPIWAISTENGKADTPEDALEMIKFIKKFLSVKCQMLSVKVLYGGSVDSKNIADFLKYKEIDGALVGGASLNPEEVKKIIKIVLH